MKSDTEAKPSPATTNAWNAALYDRNHSFVFEFGKDLLALLSPKPAERILDLGCGTGHLAQEIAAAGAEVIGIDHSEEMIAQAQRNYPHIKFQLADAGDFKFDDSFDAVFSNAVLHWIKDAEQVVTRISRALKPGGRFVAEFGGKGNVKSIIEAAGKALQAAGFPHRDQMNPWYYPSISEYTTLLEKQGLEVTYALLFDRPTSLEDGDRGLRNWIDMFANSFFDGIPSDRRAEIIEDIENRLRPQLYQNGTWFVDYKRLRVVAMKE
jgi:trans-aconitate methyltransferase